jgi:hypothetical protein
LVDIINCSFFCAFVKIQVLSLSVISVSALLLCINRLPLSSPQSLRSGDGDGDGDGKSPIYKKATTMPAAPRRAGMAVAMAPLSEAAELTLLAALLAALEALEADLAALLEALLMSLETLLEMLLATELADEEMEEMSEEAEPVRELRMEPGGEC